MSMLALALVGWMGYARVVRGTVLAVKEKEFVETARSLGASDFYIMIRHLLPNVLAPVIVMASIGVGHAILAAAGLSFLGLGVQPPTAVWGSMLSYGKTYLQSAPHLTIFPGLAIMITVLAFNFLGDGLRDILDPRLKKQEVE
jgi:peptide/nickel transport system permease protein